MNYPESQQILKEVKKAKKILINCHRSPDPDSVASAISMLLALNNLGKHEVTIISPDEIPANCRFLPNTNSIKTVDFDNFNFKSYDLFLIVDAGNWKQVSGEKNISLSRIKTVVVDHHHTNPKYGYMNLVDQTAGSCCGVLFNLFTDWKLDISPDLATALLTGIIADTMSFQTDIVGEKAFFNADKLIKLGARRRHILLNLYMTRPVDEIHLMGEMLSRVLVDKDYHFAWVGISKDLANKYPQSHDAKSYVAGTFIQSVTETDFGFVLEEYDGYSSVSFRSRVEFDVSKIAEELGGGGHKSAAAARIRLPFDQAIEKVLTVCRKYAKKG